MWSNQEEIETGQLWIGEDNCGLAMKTVGSLALLLFTAKCLPYSPETLPLLPSSMATTKYHLSSFTWSLTAAGYQQDHCEFFDCGTSAGSDEHPVDQMLSIFCETSRGLSVPSLSYQIFINPSLFTHEEYIPVDSLVSLAFIILSHTISTATIYLYSPHAEKRKYFHSCSCVFKPSIPCSSLNLEMFNLARAIALRPLHFQSNYSE